MAGAAMVGRITARGLAVPLAWAISVPCDPAVTFPQTVPDSVVSELKWRVEWLRAEGTLAVRGVEIRSRELTVALYEQRGYVPLWTDSAAVDELAREIAAVEDDGLEPGDYHPSALSRDDAGARDPSWAAETDLLRTDALARVAHDLRYGRSPRQGPSGGGGPDWPLGGPEAVAHVAAGLSGGRIGEALAGLRPKHFVYRGLVAALAELRALRDGGGWEAIDAGPTIGLDSVDARVPALRGRLVREGYLEPDLVASGDRFDAALADAVRAFQRRHGLNEDGRVGERTLRELNVPLGRRIDQVRVNLERARWLGPVLPDTFLLVDVAGARVRVFAGDTAVLERRAIVGARNTPTPSFVATMRHVDLNPTWTVPAGIVGEVLANVRRDVGYLAHHGMQVLDASGAAVDPAGIDFARYSAVDFPFVFRQDPGPTNPLGSVKLIFPNPRSVYLHDTPSRELFGREERLFSHGCIRVEDPVGLAEFLLGDRERWSRSTLTETIAAGASLTVPVARPVPVFVLYFTATADPNGTLHLSRDVYRRDESVLASLDAGPTEGTSRVHSR